MKKLIFGLLAVMMLLPFVANAQTTIYSYRCWQAEGTPVTGPIKYPSNKPRQVTLIADQSKMGNVYAGAYYNYKWYAQVTKPGTQSSLEGLYTIDYTTGERTLIAKAGSQLSDMTYDYETNTMFGIKYGAHTLVKLNIKTGAVTTVANFANAVGTAVDMLAIACDANGQMYGVCPDGYFYKIDKATAVCTALGALGAEPSFTQSMEFDRYTNRLYWANNGDYLLYEINVKTGGATPIDFIGAGTYGYDSTNSMFIPWINAPVGSPDRVTERKAVAKDSDMTISWVNPAVDIQGQEMSDFSGVKIYRDDALIATVNCTIADAGKAASYEDKGVAAGQHYYKIVPFNSKGEGGVDTDALGAYVGKNAPGAVVNFKVEQGDSKALLSWEAPSQGMYDGEFDASTITKYVVTRWSGSTATKFETSATSYADAPSFGTYSYSVYAVNEVGNGVETTSAPIMVKPADWIVMMTGETTVETSKTYKFYDAGGPNAVYPNSEIDTLVIRPTIANGVVKVEFETFDIEPYDLLTIYNGSSTKSPKIGEYSATVVPSDLVSVESTSADGALTFVFESDIMDRYSGWVAKVTATEKLQNELILSAFSGDAYVEKGNTAKYTVQVMNKGLAAVAAGDYKVVVKNASGAVVAEAQGVDVAGAATENIAVEFAPATEGEMVLTATVDYAADNNKENNSANLTVNVLAAGSQFVTIGNGTEKFSVCPASFMSGQSVSQTLYYPNEIGVKSGLLKMIAFKYDKVTSNYPNVPVKVWVTETEREDLRSSNIFSDDMTLVFDGNAPVSTTDTEWVLPLDKEYEYKGGTLAIMVFKDAPGTQFEGVYFQGDYCYGNPSAPLRTRFDSPWDETETISHNALFGWDGETHLPTTKMLFVPGTGIEDVAVEAVVKVYPNPVVSVVKIGAEVVEARLVSLSGQEVAAVEGVNEVNVENLPAGVYILTAVTADGAVIKEKVVKK